MDDKTPAEKPGRAPEGPAKAAAKTAEPSYPANPLGLTMTFIPKEHQPALKNWAIYVYMRPDHDLEPAAWKDVKEMQLANTGAGAHVVVQVDDTKDRNRLSIADGVVARLKNPPARRPTPFQDLCDFVAWADENFPGEQRMLIVWGHSRGVGIDLVGPRGEVPGMDPPAVRPPIGPALVDPHPDALTFQNLLKIGTLFKELSEQAATGGRSQRKASPNPLELLGLDSCYMSSIEFAHALRGDVERLVAAQSYIRSAGWNYAEILGYLREHEDASPADLANAIVDHVDKLDDGTTLAHLDLTSGKPQAVVDAFAALVKALRSRADDPVAAEVLGILLKRVAYLKVRQFLDLEDLCEQVRAFFGGQIGVAATAVLNALSTLVVRARAKGRAAGLLNGVSVYYDGVSAEPPLGGAAPDADAVVDLQAYRQLEFDKTTGWMNLVASIERATSALGS
jgi:hypothetical protein